MTVEEFLQRIRSVPPEMRKTMPFPEDWLTDHQVMLELLDNRIIGMDGFKYQFVEYAKECARRCSIGKRTL